jgi:hypothetical protein
MGFWCSRAAQQNPQACLNILAYGVGFRDRHGRSCEQSPGKGTLQQPGNHSLTGGGQSYGVRIRIFRYDYVLRSGRPVGARSGESCPGAASLGLCRVPGTVRMNTSAAVTHGG